MGAEDAKAAVAGAFDSADREAPWQWSCEDGELSSSLGSALTEATELLEMVRRGAMSEEEARKLIGVPSEVEEALRTIAREEPNGSGGALLSGVIEFRERVLAELERLLKSARPSALTVAHNASQGSFCAKDGLLPT